MTVLIFSACRMQHVLLKDVTSQSHQWTVRTRVVRFCEYVNSENPPRTLRIDLILLDEEGKAMEGQIPGNWIERFKPLLKEDHVYYIRYFQVRNARSQYRPVDHAYMMRFTAHTTVHEVNPVPERFPFYAYTAVPFEVLRGRIGITEYSSDAIGVFTGCSAVKIQNTRGGPKPIRNVYITDGRQTASVALWNQHATAFDAERYLELGRERPLVFLFCAMTCRMYDGKLSLQGSTLCKWYANPLLPEVAALQDSCIGRIPPPAWIGPSVGQAEPQKITISELAAFQNPHIIYNNRYIITAKIKNIVPNQFWWYLTCDNCNKTVQSHGAGYKCTGSMCNSTSGSPRYRLPIIVMDPTPSLNNSDTPTIEMVFFGPTAEEIIGAPVDALIASQAGVGAFLPTRITSLYGKIFELRVSVSPGCLQRINITYQVDGVIGVPNAPPPPVQPAPQEIQQASTTLPVGSPPANQNTSATPTTSLEVTPQKAESSMLIQELGSSFGTPAPPATPTTKQFLNPDEPARPNKMLPTLQTDQSREIVPDLPKQKRPINELEDEDYEEVSAKNRVVRRKLAMEDSPTDD